jgi:hypothetical protein
MLGIRLLLATSIVAACASSSRATLLLYDWTNDPANSVQSVTDPNGDESNGLEPTRDILKFWYARDAANHYFRLDLAAKPTTNHGAGAYSIQIDDAVGGGTTGNNSFIASGLSGVDQIVMSFFTTPINLWTGDYLFDYQGPGNPASGAALGSLGGAFTNTNNGGTTLEWSIPLSELGAGPFAFWAATSDFNVPLTYDTTLPISAAAHAPASEPASILLLATGAFGLLVVSFRRAQRERGR